MATEIDFLPQLFGGFAADGETYLPARFYVVTNADWRDALPFTKPVPNQATPLDITGIAFRAKVCAGDGQTVLADMSTENGLLVNGGTSGILSFAVPLVAGSPSPYCTSGFSTGLAVMDMLAIADGKTINLFQRSGPAQVVIGKGVT